MNRRIIGILAVVATLALAVWLGFSDGREHRRASPVEGAAGSAA